MGKVLVAVVIIGLVLVDAQDKPQCPRCSDGKPTSCTCPDGSEVEPKRKMCGKGVFPTSCTCSDGGELNIPEGGCKIGRPKCPKCSSGRPTSCTCPDGSTVDNPKKGACGERVFPTSCLVKMARCSTFQKVDASQEEEVKQLDGQTRF